MSEQPNQNTSMQNGEASKQEISIQRLYVKRITFDVPNAPQVFRSEWKPQAEFKIQSKNFHIEGDIHEISLVATVTAKLEDKIAFTAEVEQSGIFTIKGFDAEQMKFLYNSYCLNILFPYAREEISNAVVSGGFPSFYLAPMNFDAIYQEYLKKQQTENKAAETLN